MQAHILDLLKTHFGYDSFRDQQEEIIQHALQGNDSLIIMPTGGGKSLCYQLPALAMEGCTLVISPLIALMQDQVDSLRANGIAASAINSSVSSDEVREAANLLQSGELKLLFVSPERALSPRFVSFLQDKEISLIAVDEAHCVSIWGNDFRQEYTRLPELMRHFPSVPRMALTATADKATQKDIADKLELRTPRRFLSSFERKNLHISVLPAVQRMKQITDFVSQRKDDSGIIYCLSRKSTEQVAEKLRNIGISAAHYHAQLSSQERYEVQRAFQQDEIKVICATIAFGMGIDKPNIRYVLHYNLPKNIESYYQEIGRAGRDGLPADTILFFSMGDAQILRNFIDESEADDSFKIVQRSKLSRMLEFGLAGSCRTNMVLSYFGEHRADACRHCDNCLHPPQLFDGTILAQKALSAVKRTQESVASHMLVDILRGSERADVLQHGFHEIKTFGSGKDISREDWLSYVSQMVNQGLLEIDFTDYNKLRVTEIGELVLFKGLKIKLSKPQQLAETSYEKRKSKTERFEEGLVKELKALRLHLAKLENVPPYIIFNDATLEEMSVVKPAFMSDMAEISGLGQYKMEKYGALFLDAIKKYMLEQSEMKQVKGKTYLETYAMLRDGLSPEQIAEKRKLNTLTVYSHIATLYDKGEPIDLSLYISDREINDIAPAWYKLNKTDQLKELYEHLSGKFEYHKLRLAIAFLKKP
ncbi:MAG: DNA helicase RecQ [Cyclobacteriaceae bacterium]